MDGITTSIKRYKFGWMYAPDRLGSRNKQLKGITWLRFRNGASRFILKKQIQPVAPSVSRMKEEGIFTFTLRTKIPDGNRPLPLVLPGSNGPSGEKVISKLRRITTRILTSLN
nr:hypothetical protein [Alteribacter salitolerans]